VSLKDLFDGGGLENAAAPTLQVGKARGLEALLQARGERTEFLLGPVGQKIAGGFLASLLDASFSTPS
jgi:hypothetical protein